MMRHAAVLAVLTVLAAQSALAAPEPGFTLYSDVCYHRDSGDILGTRMGILRLPEASYLYLQFAEGDFTPPQLVKLDRQGDRLSFSAQILAKGPMSVFHGRITGAMPTGAFDDHAQAPSGKTRFDLRMTSAGKKGFSNCK